MGSEMSSYKFKTSDLGLAAYLDMNWPRREGWARSIGRENNVWLFESDRILSDWQIEYLHSESSCHDKQLMTMRNMINDERGHNYGGRKT
jgi:hypothetical protein